MTDYDFFMSGEEYYLKQSKYFFVMTLLTLNS